MHCFFFKEIFQLQYKHIEMVVFVEFSLSVIYLVEFSLSVIYMYLVEFGVAVVSLFM